MELSVHELWITLLQWARLDIAGLPLFVLALSGQGFEGNWLGSHSVKLSMRL